MKEIKYILIIEDNTEYHQGVASSRRLELEEVEWLDYRLESWFSNSSNLNPIKNL